MNISNMARYVGVCVAVTLLAACSSGGSQSSSLAPTALNPAATGTHGTGLIAKHGMVPSLAARSATKMRPNHHKSWVSPDAKRAPRLLFVSDYGAGVVNIYTMPAMALKGQLTGFSSPEGMCEDGSGNIWIANTGLQEMLQYSRTGTLLNTLSVPNEFPASCAVNKTNNDLAVSNIAGTGGPGNIEVFTNASGTGTPYTDPNIYQYFFVGYDNNGNLFYDGTNQSRSASFFGELPAGSSTTTTINLSGGTLYLAGFVQWYSVGNYVALGDQMCGGTTASCIYWVSVSGSTGTITGTTNLTSYTGGAVCDLVEGVIAANLEKYVAGPDYEGTCGSTSTTDRWAYEGGGSPTNYNATSSLVEPIGAAVSVK